MKTIYFSVVALFIMPLFSFAPLKTNTTNIVNQDLITVEAVFDGHEDYGYNFIVNQDNQEEEYTLTFQKINKEVSSEFDLESDALLGTKFKITYTTETIVTKDADGYEDEDIVNTITKLEKL